MSSPPVAGLAEWDRPTLRLVARIGGVPYAWEDPQNRPRWHAEAHCDWCGGKDNLVPFGDGFRHRRHQ